MRSAKLLLIYFIIIISIASCSLPKETQTKSSQAELKLPDIPPEIDIQATPGMVEEYARIHQISNLRVAEFYLVHPIYAKGHPYNPTEEDVAFYERAFLEKAYPEFNELEARIGFKGARSMLMNNPANGPGNRFIGSKNYTSIMQKFTLEDSEASTGKTNPLMETDPATFYFEEGMRLHSEKRIDEAIGNLGKAVKIKPESPALTYNLGLMYMEKGDNKSAEQYLKSSLENIKSTEFTKVNLAMYPETYMGTLVNLGILYIHNSEYEEAIGVLKEAIQFRSGDQDANINLGNAYYLMGDLENAAVQIGISLKLTPNNPELHNLIGLIYYQKGLYEASLAEFQTARKLKPDERQYSFNTGLALIRLGRQDEAENEFKNASGFKDNSDLSQAFLTQITANKLRETYNEGYSAMKNGQINQAIDLFEAVLRQKPDMVEAHINLGVCYRIRGDKSKQIYHFTEALKLRPDMPDIHYNLGLVYSDTGMYQQAIAEFDKAVELRPSYQDAHFQLGIMLYKNKNYADAALEFQQCIRLSPNWLEAHLNLGSCYLKLGNINGSVEHFKESVRINQNSAEAHYSLGSAYMHLEKYSEAYAEFHKALGIDPTHYQSKAMLKELETLGYRDNHTP
jgi:tetratricopeptide (TPR) repeat protein